MGKEQMHAIVHRHDQLRWIEERRIMMRHMHDVYILSSQRERNRDVMLPQRLFLRLIELPEIYRKRNKLVKVSMRADKEILVLRIDRRKIAHEIPDVRPDAEFIDFPDIDRDTHKPCGHYKQVVLWRCLMYLAITLVATSAAQADSSTVLVFPFENLSDDRTLDWIGEGISELIISRLQTEPGVYTFSREERLTAYEKVGIPESAMITRATALKLGWSNGLDNIITGTFSGTADDFHILARLVDMDAGAASQIRAEGKLQDVIPLTTTLSWQLLRKIIPGTASPESDYTARPPTPRSPFENYIRALLSQDLQKRIDLLQTAVRLYPQYGPALFQLGRAYHLQRDFAMSNQWLEKLPESTPERRQVLFTLGLNYFYIGDFARAVTTFQQLPQTYDVLLNLGAALSRKGDLPAAMSAWQRAAKMDSLSSEAFFNLGYGSFIRADWAAAEKYLSESLKVRGRD